MPDSGRAEIYFIAAMMVLILVVSAAACIFFFKTYRKEMRDKEEARQAKLKEHAENTVEKEVAQ